MANSSKQPLTLSETLSNWYEKQTNYNWNQVLITLYSNVQKWTKTKSGNNDDASAFRSSETFANNAYLWLLKELTGQDDSEEAKNAPIIGDKRKPRKNAIKITKQFLLENMKQYSATSTVAFLKNRTLQYCKDFNDEIIQNKYQKNFRNTIYKILHNDLMVSNNEQYKNLATKMLESPKQESGKALSIQKILHKPSNKKIADIVNKSFKEYSNIQLKASPREKSRAKKDYLKNLIITLSQLNEFKNISSVAMADALFKFCDSRNSLTTSLNTTMDSEDDSDEMIDFIPDEENGYENTEENLMLQFEDGSSVISRKAHDILNKYLPTVDSKKPAAKQIKAYLIHYAIIQPEFIARTEFPTEIINKLNTLLLSKGKRAQKHDEIKTRIIAKILNQTPNTSLYQIEQFIKELGYSYKSLCQQSESFAENYDIDILRKTLVALAVKKLGNRVENYTSCDLNTIGGNKNE